MRKFMDGGSSDCSSLLMVSLSAAANGAKSGNITFLVILFIVFIVIGGYFAGAESSYSAMDKIKLKSKADAGDKRAKIALYISNNFDRAITTLLIGNNITHIAAGSIATLITVKLFADENGALSSGVSMASTFIATGIVFLFSEMIPKSFANDRSNTVSLLFAKSLRFLMKVFKPFASFFMGISKFFTKLFSGEQAPSMTEDELLDMLDTAEDEGVMDEEQTDLIKSAFSFSDKDAGDVMTMREDIFAVNGQLSNPQILEILKSCNHSRTPVYVGELDNVIGILNIRAFFRQYSKNPKFNIRSILTPVFYAHKDDKIDDLLNEMSLHKSSIALVTDDDGYLMNGNAEKAPGEKKNPHPHIVGIASIEDFVEELVGEIWDEDDIVDENFIKLGGNRFKINAALTLSDAFSRIGLVNRNKAEAKKSVGEWAYSHVTSHENGDTPGEDDYFLYDDTILVTIDEVDDSGKPVAIIFHILDDEELEEYHAEHSSDADGNAGMIDGKEVVR